MYFSSHDTQFAYLPFFHPFKISSTKHGEGEPRGAITLQKKTRIKSFNIIKLINQLPGGAGRNEDQP